MFSKGCSSLPNINLAQWPRNTTLSPKSFFRRSLFKIFKIGFKICFVILVYVTFLLSFLVFLNAGSHYLPIKVSLQISKLKACVTLSSQGYPISPDMGSQPFFITCNLLKLLSSLAMQTEAKLAALSTMATPRASFAAPASCRCYCQDTAESAQDFQLHLYTGDLLKKISGVQVYYVQKRGGRCTTLAFQLQVCERDMDGSQKYLQCRPVGHVVSCTAFESGRAQGLSEPGRLIWSVLVWQQWKERNQRVFEEKEVEAKDVIDKIKFMIWKWIASQSEMKSIIIMWPTGTLLSIIGGKM